jgi:hypothetical protein
MLLPMLETSQLIALQALLALLPPRRKLPPLKRLGHDQGNALTNLREGDRRGPFFSPDRFPAPETTWPVMTACDGAATLSHDAPHRRPHRLRSCSAGDMLPGDVPLWPRGPTPIAGSQGPHWPEKSRLSRPWPARGHGSEAPPLMPRHLADAGGCWRPHAVGPSPPPGDLWPQRGHRGAAMPWRPARGSRPARCARAAWADLPAHATLGAASPEPGALGSRGPPAESARPRPPGAAGTRTDAPSRHPRPSPYAGARHRVPPASPRPPGDACARPGTLWAHPLCPGAPYPWSSLSAETAGCRPGGAPGWRPSPRRWPPGRYRLDPGDHPTVWLPPPTPDRIGETRTDRTPTPHRLGPSASRRGLAPPLVRAPRPPCPNQ